MISNIVKCKKCHRVFGVTGENPKHVFRCPHYSPQISMKVQTRILFPYPIKT